MKWKFIIIDEDGVTGTNEYDKAVRHLTNEYTTVINCEAGTVVQPSDVSGGTDTLDLAINEQKLYV